MNLNNFKQKLIDENFFRPRWYSILINPYFIGRFALYRNLKKFAKNLQGSQKILDVGCGVKPYQRLFKNHQYLGIDIQGGGHTDLAKNADKFFDGVNIPYSDYEFNILICTQVLEHSLEPERLLKECYRVLKNEGVIFLSLPFVYPEHETPFDFRRLTSYGLKKIIEQSGFTVISLSPTTRFFSTVGQLFSVFIFESIKFRNPPLKFLISLLILFPIQLISIILDLIFRNKALTIDYIVIAKK